MSNSSLARSRGRFLSTRWWRKNLDKLVKREPTAVKWFTRAYLPIIESWVRLHARRDVDDLTQAAWLHVLEAIHQVDAERLGTVDGWLKRVVLHFVIGQHRRRKRSTAISLDIDDSGREGGSRADDLPDRKARDPLGKGPPIDLLEKSLDELPRFDRLLVQVATGWGVPQVEIAAVVGKSNVWINRRLNQVLESLRRTMTSLNHMERTSGRSRPAASKTNARRRKRDAEELDLLFDRLLLDCIDRQDRTIDELSGATGLSRIRLLRHVGLSRERLSHRQGAVANGAVQTAPLAT